MRGVLLFFLVFLSARCFPQVKINEVYIQPAFDSTGVPTEFMTNCIDTTVGAEWVEIYNSSRCDTVDLSCFMLGARTSDSNRVTFAFPANTFLPPLSFVVVGGGNVPNADFRLPDYCADANVCGIGVWHLENDYGWVALYDANGAVMDAVFWTALAGEANQLASNSAYSGQPCVPGSCTAASLKAASQMTPGVEIAYAGQAPGSGLSIYRQTDGSGGWLTNGFPTEGTCNGVCVTPSNLAVQVTGSGDETCLQGNGWAQVSYTGGVGPYDVDWSNTANADSIFGLDAGCYRVTVTDDSGCYQTDSVCIANIGTPVSVSIVPAQSTIFKGESIQLSIVTQAILDSIIWSPAASLDCDDCMQPVASPVTITTYTVDVIDSNGCTGTADATVAVLSDENSTFIPTAFTPNDDNLNDLLFVRSPKLVSLDFRIFDRWGSEVFATTDMNTGWDGKDKNGKEVDVGIYVYYAVVTFDNGKLKTLKGNVAVLR